MQQTLNELLEILEWLECHNKNYNSNQYYRIIKAIELIKGEQE